MMMRTCSNSYESLARAMLSSADQVSDTTRAPAEMRSAVLVPSIDRLADVAGLGRDNTVLCRNAKRQVSHNILVEGAIDYPISLWRELTAAAPKQKRDGADVQFLVVTRRCALSLVIRQKLERPIIRDDPRDDLGKFREGVLAPRERNPKIVLNFFYCRNSTKCFFQVGAARKRSPAATPLTWPVAAGKEPFRPSGNPAASDAMRDEGQPAPAERRKGGPVKNLEPVINTM